MKKTAAIILLLVSCGGTHAVATRLDPDPTNVPMGDASTQDSSSDSGSTPLDSSDGSTSSVSNNGETDNGCGGPSAPKCGEGKNCLVDSDCTVACNYNHVCVSAPSCRVHFGGDTCGSGEVGDKGSTHETCCKTIEVSGFIDQSHLGKSVYLDKYEITSGRIRAFIYDVSLKTGAVPNVKSWVAAHQPAIWNSNWNVFLPSDFESGSLTINRLLLGDPRHDGQTQAQAGPGVILPPATDQTVNVGLSHQFGGQVYADVHGNNCGTFAGAYGFPTYWYPSDVQVKNGEVPRVPTQELLDVKSMNCVTSAMLAAFCAWDGGQLATDEVIDYVTGSPERSDDVSGCGTQYDSHGELLGNVFTNTVQSGGRCPDVAVINATFDAGDNLPVPGSPLNKHLYSYPDVGPGTSDKVWQIAAPGRVVADNVNGWMDLAGNLSEVVVNKSTGNFGLKGRGIGYGSARSDLNATLMPGETILRIQRPEVKSALWGGRCMRFK
jgi:hypothetical protein